MSKVQIYAMTIATLCLTTFIASQAGAQDKTKKQEVKAQPAGKSLCEHVIAELSDPDTKKTPTVIVGLDEGGNFTSALFVDKGYPSNCAKALPYPFYGGPIPISKGVIDRVQPFVYLNYPGSGCHFLGYDAGGKAIWYCHN